MHWCIYYLYKRKTRCHSLHTKQQRALQSWSQEEKKILWQCEHQTCFAILHHPLCTIGTGKLLLAMDCCFSSQCSLLWTTRMTSTSHWLSLVNQKPQLFLNSGLSIVMALRIDVFSSFAKKLCQRSSLSASGLIIWMSWASLSSSSVLLTTWCLEWRVSMTILQRRVWRFKCCKRRHYITSWPISSTFINPNLAIKLPVTRCLWVPSATMTTNEGKHQCTCIYIYQCTCICNLIWEHGYHSITEV